MNVVEIRIYATKKMIGWIPFTRTGESRICEELHEETRKLTKSPNGLFTSRRRIIMNYRITKHYYPDHKGLDITDITQFSHPSFVTLTGLILSYERLMVKID